MSDTEKRTCPECGAPAEPEAIICIKCGVNFKTGIKAMPSEPLPAEVEEEEEEEQLSFGERAAYFVGANFPGLIQPLLLLVCLILAGGGFVGMYMMFNLFLRGLVLGALPLGLLGAAAWIQGLGMLMMGCFSTPTDWFEQYENSKWSVYFVVFFLGVGLTFLAARLLIDPAELRRSQHLPAIVSPIDERQARRPRAGGEHRASTDQKGATPDGPYPQRTRRRIRTACPLPLNPPGISRGALRRPRCRL